MAARRPLVLVGGRLKDLPAGDSIDFSLLSGLPTTLAGHGITLTSGNVTTALGYTPLNAASYTAADVLSKLLTVDGPGSNLDADLLDGQQGSYYAAAASLAGYLPVNNPTYTGTLTGPGLIARAWSSSDTDIDGLIPGTTSGLLIEGPTHSHVTIGIRSNDGSDGFYILDKGNSASPATDPYVNLLLAVSQSAFTYKGHNVHHAGNFDPSTKLNVANPAFTGLMDGAGSIQLTGALFADTVRGLGAGHTLNIYQPTVDGADSGRVIVHAGGSVSNARGPYALFHGNEYAVDPGKLTLVSGFDADIRLVAAGVGVISLESEVKATGNIQVLKSGAVVGVGLSGSYNGGIANYGAAGVGQVGLFSEHAGGTLYLRPNGRLDTTGQVIINTASITRGGNTVWDAGNLVPSSGTRALTDTEASYSASMVQVGEGTTSFPGTPGTTLTAKYSNTRTFQLYAPYAGGTTVPDLYFRTSHTTSGGGGWTGLQKLFHEGNLSPARLDASNVFVAASQTINHGSTNTDLYLQSSGVLGGGLTANISGGVSYTILHTTSGLIYLRPEGRGTSTNQVVISSSNITRAGNVMFDAGNYFPGTLTASTTNQHSGSTHTHAITGFASLSANNEFAQTQRIDVASGIGDWQIEVAGVQRGGIFADANRVCLYGSSGATLYLRPDGRASVTGQATLTAAGLFTAPSLSDSIGNVRDIPRITRNSTTAIQSTDGGKAIVKDNASAYTWQVGTGTFTTNMAVTVINDGSAGNVTISQGAGMTLVHGTSSGNFTLAPGESRTLYGLSATRVRVL